MDLTLNSAVLGVELSGMNPVYLSGAGYSRCLCADHRRAGPEYPGRGEGGCQGSPDANDTHYPPGNGYPYRPGSP